MYTTEFEDLVQAMQVVENLRIRHSQKLPSAVWQKLHRVYEYLNSEAEKAAADILAPPPAPSTWQRIKNFLRLA